MYSFTSKLTQMHFCYMDILQCLFFAVGAGLVELILLYSWRDQLWWYPQCLEQSTMIPELKKNFDKCMMSMLAACYHTANRIKVNSVGQT